MEYIDLYTPEIQEALRYKDDEHRRNADDHHQKIKKASRYQGKVVREIDIDGVFYESGRHFEDFTPEEISNFDLLTDLNEEIDERIDEEINEEIDEEIDEE